MNTTPDYTAKKISSSIVIDGDVKKEVWKNARWSRRFVDLVTAGTALYNTRSAILWNDTHLYLAFYAEERFVEAKLTKRGDIIFLENDLELFIDGGDCYYEFEVNALNTVYEVFFIWKDAYTKGSKFDIPVFDVHQSDAYTFGGNDDRADASFWKGTHPRGIRWAFPNYEMPGLQSAVKIDGTLNDNSDIDEGWSLEIAIPWKSLELLANGRSLPPENGDVWSMFLGRFEKLVQNGIEVQPHPATALNSHGVYDAHLPDKWSKIAFIDEK